MLPCSQQGVDDDAPEVAETACNRYGGHFPSVQGTGKMQSCLGLRVAARRILPDEDGVLMPSQKDVDEVPRMGWELRASGPCRRILIIVLVLAFAGPGS